MEINSQSLLHELFASAAKQFDSKPAVQCIDRDGKLTVLSYGRVKYTADAIANQLIKGHIDAGQEVIAVLSQPSALLPAILIGILQTGKAFCSVSHLNELRSAFPCPVITHIIAVHHNYNDRLAITDDLQIVDRIETDFGFQVQLLRIKYEFLRQQAVNDTGQSESQRPQLLAYVVRTSGTTGVPKLVRVPHRCIVPNILHLRPIFGIVESDVVTLLAPLTFDPSIVEIFIALASGAALLVVPEAVRIVPRVLSRYLRDNNVTIVQATPSLVLRFGRQLLQEELLAKDSRLRILALGGEPCPDVQILQSWKAEGNRTIIYNLYGTTEVSCWASWSAVTLRSEQQFLEVPLGEPLSETLLEVRDAKGQVIAGEGHGQLFIGSRTRFCAIDQEKLPLGCKEIKHPVWRETGDWVRVQNGQIFFDCRKDGLVKHNGKKIDLNKVKAAVSSQECVDSCYVMYDKVVLVFVVLDTAKCEVAPSASELNQSVIEYLKAMDQNVPPIKVQIVPSIPVTAHGKIDVSRLRRFTLLKGRESTLEEAEDTIRQLWIRHLGLGTKNVQNNDNFVRCGGNSVGAVQLALEIEFFLRKSSPGLIDAILNLTFGDILREVLGLSSFHRAKRNGKKALNEEECIPTLFRSPSISGCFEVQFRSISYSRCLCSQCKEETVVGLETNWSLAKLRWSFDLGKCVDSSPLLVSYRGGNTVVFVGSHSGLFATINHDCGTPFWTSRLKDRIESSPCLSSCGKYVLVGCYDFCLYCFCVEMGTLRWKFETRGEVKSSPVCLGPSVFFGSHDGCLYAVETESGSALWSAIIDDRGKKPVFASPAVCSQPLSCIYCASLDGTVAAFDPVTGVKLWSHFCDKPVFSSPLVHDQGVCIGCVDGHLLFLSHDGVLKWSYDSGAPIFCSPSSCRGVILCGNHAGRLFCLDGETGSLLWLYCCTSQSNSSIYGRQTLLASRSVVTVRTDGQVQIVDSKDGRESFGFKLDGQIFSSPVAFRGTLLIGCRDNNMYCYDLIQ